MKLSFERSDLMSAINIVLKAIPGKTTMPILECFLIDASTDTIKITANDTDMGIETIVDGKILEKGKIAVDAKLFSEIIRKLPDSELIMDEENENITISCEKSNFKIPGRRGDDYPLMPEVESQEYICLSQLTLKDVITQTIFSIAANENNKMMTGELFEVRGDTLRVASLDGHRIAIRNVRLKDSYQNKKVIIPGKTLLEVSHVLEGNNDKEVYLFFSRNYVLFQFNNTKVLSRLIEGEYFQIDQMISKDYETSIRVNKKDFLDSIDRSVLLVRESDKKPIVLNIKDNDMEVSLNSVIGSMREDFSVEQHGKDIVIAFNPRFLLDALRVIDDETVSVYMVNSKAPCFIRDEEENYIYLILPVNFIR